MSFHDFADIYAVCSPVASKRKLGELAKSMIVDIGELKERRKHCEGLVEEIEMERDYIREVLSDGFTTDDVLDELVIILRRKIDLVNETLNNALN